jgi:hypothetical protein
MKSYTGGKSPINIGAELGWAPESVWTLWSRKKNSSPYRESNPGHPFHSKKLKDYYVLRLLFSGTDTL